jgi:hypothetical protein
VTGAATGAAGGIGLGTLISLAVPGVGPALAMGLTRETRRRAMLGFERQTTRGGIAGGLGALAGLGGSGPDLGQVRSRLRELSESVRTRGLPAGLARLGAPARRSGGAVGPGSLALAGLGGMAVGAVLMYLLDPGAGPERRARLRERLRRYRDRTTRTVDETSRELLARGRGLVVDLRDRMRGSPRPTGSAREVRGPEAR